MSDKKNKILVTHNGSFHADDIFACATLALMLEKQNESFEVVRTRDEAIIASGNYVFDVGGEYNEEKNRFDHHQVGGAGKRNSGIEYASFGLVWKKFGAGLCGSSAVAEIIEKKLVQPIDAGDNGMDLVTPLNKDIKPYFIHNVFGAFRPSWKNSNEETLLAGFWECVKIATNILQREIILSQDIVEVKGKVDTLYKKSEDKQILILEEKYPWHEQVSLYPEPVFVVFPRSNDNTWGAEGVPASSFSFERRKKFPASWAGLRDEELQKTSGVSDAVFCHRGLFMAVAKSKEGALKLAQKALNF